MYTQYVYNNKMNVNVHIVGGKIICPIHSLPSASCIYSLYVECPFATSRTHIVYNKCRQATLQSECGSMHPGIYDNVNYWAQIWFGIIGGVRTYAGKLTIINLKKSNKKYRLPTWATLFHKHRHEYPAHPAMWTSTRSWRWCWYGLDGDRAHMAQCPSSPLQYHAQVWIK